MSQQLLQRANVGVRLQKMRCEAVAQGMHRHGLVNACLGHSRLEGTLQLFFEKTVSVLNAIHLRQKACCFVLG